MDDGNERLGRGPRPACRPAGRGPCRSPGLYSESRKAAGALLASQRPWPEPKHRRRFRADGAGSGRTIPLMGDAARSSHDKAATRAHLEAYLESYPGLRGRVCRVLLLHLHTMGLSRIEEIYKRAARAEEWHIPGNPNVPSAQLWAADEKEVINNIVIDLAAEHLSPSEVDNIVWAAHQRDEAKSVESLARMPDVPLDLIAHKVSQYASIASAHAAASLSGTPKGTLVALIRRFISDSVDYISVAKRYLDIHDISWVLERTVSTERGSGWVGGKAAGMLLAWSILRAKGYRRSRAPQHRVRADRRLHGVQGAQRAHRTGRPQVPAARGDPRELPRHPDRVSQRGVPAPRREPPPCGARPVGRGAAHRAILEPAGGLLRRRLRRNLPEPLPGKPGLSRRPASPHAGRDRRGLRGRVLPRCRLLPQASRPARSRRADGHHDPAGRRDAVRPSLPPSGRGRRVLSKRLPLEPTDPARGRPDAPGARAGHPRRGPRRGLRTHGAAGGADDASRDRRGGDRPGLAEARRSGRPAGVRLPLGTHRDRAGGDAR